MLDSTHLLMLSQFQCQTKGYEQTRNSITSRQKCSTIEDGNQVLPTIKHKAELTSRLLATLPTKESNDKTINN